MTLSLYGQYIQERLGRGIVETSKGFITFEFPSPEVVYIVDMYIHPKHRRSGTVKKMVDKICEESCKQGRKYLLGSVDTTAKNAEYSIKIMQKYGMVPCKVQEPMIFFSKKIGE